MAAAQVRGASRTPAGVPRTVEAVCGLRGRLRGPRRQESCVPVSEHAAAGKSGDRNGLYFKHVGRHRRRDGTTDKLKSHNRLKGHLFARPIHPIFLEGKGYTT